MKVAGKHHEHYLDQFIVKKVNLLMGRFLVPNLVLPIYCCKIAFKEQRGQGLGRLLFHMIQCYMQDVYETDRLGTSASPEVILNL